ncbi:MAG: hypothetical protein MUF78_07715 [Candidatus Edwardsbacteria bacterium]|nr:hypothetical protein [Candidatus Edwardsbacteria bacterium]
MDRLHRCNHAQPREPRDIVRVHQLAMFDPVPQSDVARPGLLERVQRDAVGRVADGVHRAGDAAGGGCGDQRQEFIAVGGQHAARSAFAIRLEQVRGLGAQRAVGEQLQPAELQPVVAQAGPDPQGYQGFQRLFPQVVHGAQPQLPFLVQRLQQHRCLLRLHGVEPGQSHPDEPLLPGDQRRAVLPVRRLGDERIVMVGRLLAQDAAGAALGILLDHAAGLPLFRRGDAERADRRAVDPGRVPVLAPQERGIVRRDCVEVRRGGQPVVVPDVPVPAAAHDPFARPFPLGVRGGDIEAPPQ